VGDRIGAPARATLLAPRPIPAGGENALEWKGAACGEEEQEEEEERLEALSALAELCKGR